MRNKTKNFTSIQTLLHKYNVGNKNKYVSREFQDYGYRLACELDDEKRASLYIKLAKTEDRAVLERAKCFVKDAKNVKSKGRLFMWKLKILRSEFEK